MPTKSSLAQFRIEEDEFADTVTTALESLFPGDPPRFLARTPHGYCDHPTIERNLASGGFTASLQTSTVAARSRATSSLVPALAYCQGTPLRNEIEARDDQMPVVRTRAGTFSPVELSAIMLDHLRDIATAHTGQPVTHAVVTVPANFNDAQRSATASAGAIAGLEVVRVLNEPTAAALAYGATRRLNEIIAVYDFGGGTFDLTVMKLEDQLYTVLGTAGDSFLGGDDIDERIVERMLSQVVANLMTNAMHYTLPGGRVSIETEVVVDDGARWVTLRVSDSGLGIPVDEVDHVFERFYRGSASRRMGTPGTGLGLSICKEILDRHKGRISVQSRVGEGSTFTIWLPNP